MSNDTIMTITGNVVDSPRMRRTKSGHPVSNFRVASTSRRYDREKEQFVDNATLFVNVTCWRAMAENVHASVHKGQPVVVTGRYYSREYTVADQARTSYELEASAIGHDLARGVSRFDRAYRNGSTVTAETDDNGVPVDDSDHWLDLAEPAADATGPADRTDIDDGDVEFARSADDVLVPAPVG